MIAATMFLDASQGLVVAPMAARSVARTVDPSMAVGLVYSTTTGNTETVAGYIEEATGLSMTDIADLSGEDVAGFDGAAACQTLLGCASARPTQRWPCCHVGSRQRAGHLHLQWHTPPDRAPSLGRHHRGRAHLAHGRRHRALGHLLGRVRATHHSPALSAQRRGCLRLCD